MEDFVTYEQALALKRLGFKEECLFFYNVHGEFNPNSVYDGYSDVNDASRSLNLQGRSKLAGDAPTLVQTQKWLRKEKGLYLIWDMGQDRKHDSKFAWYVCDRHGYIVDTLASEIKYDSPEEALSEGITECLNFLELENDKEK